MGHSCFGGPSLAGGAGPGDPREVSLPPVPAAPSRGTQGCQPPAGWQRWHWGCHDGVRSLRGWQRRLEADQAHPRRVIHSHPGCAAWCSPRFWLHQGSDPGLWQPRTCPGASPLLAWEAHLCLQRVWVAGRAEPCPFLRLSPGSGSPGQPEVHPGTGSTGQAGSSHEGRAWSWIPAEPCPTCLDVPVLLRAGEGRAGARGQRRWHCRALSPAGRPHPDPVLGSWRSSWLLRPLMGRSRRWGWRL